MKEQVAKIYSLLLWANKWGYSSRPTFRRLQTKEEFLDEDTVNINLADYEFNYTGNLYGIIKNNCYNSSRLQYQRIVSDGASAYWYISPNAIYTGTPMTIKIGDDILISSSNNENVRLKDDDYYFSEIVFDSSYIQNGNSITIPFNTYDCELWVRYKDKKDYALYQTFKNSIQKWSFEDNNIVGFYFLIHDVKSSIKSKTWSSTSGQSQSAPVTATTVFNKKDISESGTLYNFCYLQVFFKDKDGNLVLQNEPELESYSNLITKDDIATFDKDIYGTYMQRDYSSYSWDYYKIKYNDYLLGTRKNFEKISQDINNETFLSSFNISAYAYEKDNHYAGDLYKEQYGKEYAFLGFKIYDLLPNGMELDSTSTEIIDTQKISIGYVDIRDSELNIMTEEELNSNTKTEVNIIKNWKNTGRTKIEIIVKFNKPLFIFNRNGNSHNGISASYNIKYKYSFNSFLEFGNVINNYSYVKKLPTQEAKITYNGSVNDNGSYDADAIDIDEDGDKENILGFYKATATITSIISTHQDVQKSVKTNLSNYSIGTVKSSYDSEYEYKLRVRTGQNDITNLVIYDSIEEYTQNPNGDIVHVYGSKPHWNGEFLGVDTSYAESKGYVVKPYYSENVLAGNLYNDDGSLNSDWKEYVNDDEDIYEYGEPKTITSPNWPNNYNNNMTETKSYWEISYPGAESIEIKFNSTCKLESASYDYLRFYDKNGNNITSSVCDISADKIGGTDMAGKTYTIPGDYVKITMRTDGSGVYKGFLADIVSKTFKETHYGTDKSKVKALAFEYLDADGNPAKLPANSLTYVLIKMKSPADENITSLAYNGCRTQWQALDDYDRPVDFITGINSNIVKVSLPNSVEDKEVNLSFNKIIDATDEDFKKLKLDKDSGYNFFISLTNQKTGEVINGLLDSKEGFRVTNIPTGTYIIKEEDDIWFNFVSMGLSEQIEGIDFQEVDGDYILTINAIVESDTVIEIDITNKPDEERFYDSKYDIKNLFNLTK